MRRNKRLNIAIQPQIIRVTIVRLKKQHSSTNRRKITKSQSVRFLTVGQTARILAISPSTLRLWENVGLVTPARSAGRYRLYTPDLLEILKRIKYLRDVKKLNVPGIKQALAETLPAKAREVSKPNPRNRGKTSAAPQ
ncbi:MAG TPA: MerR family transcriptional regulator [Terriglobales bacterium]